MSGSQKTVPALAFWSIIIAGHVFLLKILAWWVTGSVALYSDALESVINIITATITFWALRISHKPADTNHHYGHHKVEYFSAILQGIFICVAAFLIFWEAFNSWKKPIPLDNPWLGIALSTCAMVINIIWMILILKTGIKEKSPALIADGKHIISDVLTSLIVLTGLSGMFLFTHWQWLDPLLGIAVAFPILWQGAKLICLSVHGLMDPAANIHDTLHIQKIISDNLEGALNIQALKTRIAGRATFIEFDLIVDANVTVEHSHTICDRLEEALKKEIPNLHIIIHVEPVNMCKAYCN